jgi:hypothetical protein
MEQSVSCIVRGCDSKALPLHTIKRAAFHADDDALVECYLCNFHNAKYKGDWSLIKRWMENGNCSKAKCIDVSWCIFNCTVPQCKHTCSYHEE